MLYSIRIIEKKAGCISDDCPQVHTKEGDAHEYNGGINSVVGNFCGTVLHRRS